jgi:4-methyl-5(b-hydroxyethyl)-thiazole monophosphate biosynthesis
MKKNMLVFLADGFEEVEAVMPVDYLRRAGIEVIIAAITPDKTVTGSHGIILTADTTISELENSGKLTPASWDGAFVPGGIPGAPNLAACMPAGNFFKEMAANGKIIGAICASPVVFFAPLGILEGKKFTCYPGMEKEISSGTWQEENVVVDGNLVTSRAAGTTVDFSLALIECLVGKDAVNNLVKSALL